jgi:regulator of sigma E protease
MFTILVFLVVLSVLVVAHELGHFWAARRAGIKVEEFGLGFPPKLYSWKDKEGTEWSLNLIPLGGFVRMQGENGEGPLTKGSFSLASPGARLLTLAGGVLMNTLMAWFLYSLAALGGSPTILETPELLAQAEEKAVTIVEIAPNSPASAEDKITIGQHLFAVNGAEVVDAASARALLTAAQPGTEIVLSLGRQADEQTDVVVTAAYIESIDRSGVGVGLVDTGIIKTPWYQAPLLGAQDTWWAFVGVVSTFGALLISPFTGSNLVAQLSGPVGIASMTGEVARLGFTYLLRFAAMLSVNLAVLNILPFPALDGGRIALLALEVIRRGRRLTAQAEGYIHASGFALLMILVVFVTYRDIVRLFF